MGKRVMPDYLSSRPFEDLGELIDVKGRSLPKKSGPESTCTTPSDEQLFAEAMKKVREIKEFREITVRSKKTSPPRRDRCQQEQIRKALHDITRGTTPINLPDTQEYVEWIHPGCRKALARKLHRGDFAVQDCIDLHGYTIDEAETEIARFLNDCLKKHLSCVKIIHGRGLRSPNGPVLKSSVVTWLSGRYRKHVRSFVSARQCDGGLGAIYVLLNTG